jgi:hypothetical protein
MMPRLLHVSGDLSCCDTAPGENTAIAWSFDRNVGHEPSDYMIRILFTLKSTGQGMLRSLKSHGRLLSWHDLWRLKLELRVLSFVRLSEGYLTSQLRQSPASFRDRCKQKGRV